jgi:hypothetical protein
MLKYTIDIFQDDDTDLWSATIEKPVYIEGNPDLIPIWHVVDAIKDLELYELNDRLIEWLGRKP